MDFEQVKQKMENSEDKLNIFLDNWKGLKNRQSIDLVNEYLTDEEIIQILKNNDFEDFLKINFTISIKDENKRIHMFRQETFENPSWQVEEFLESLSEEKRANLIQDGDFLKQYSVSKYKFENILKSLNQEHIIEIMKNKELIEEIGLVSYDIEEVIKNINDDNEKIGLMEKYDLPISRKASIICSLQDDKKKEQIILENKYGFDIVSFERILSSMQTENIGGFFSVHKEFCKAKQIVPYNVVDRLDVDHQLEFVSKMEDFDLIDKEKKEVLVILKDETKTKIDKLKLSPKHREVLDLPCENKRILIELQEDLERYRDLGRIIRINPMQKTKEERKAICKLCEICPDTEIEDDLKYGVSTGKEYIEGETWIEDVLNGIKTEWTDLQKIAYIDNAIGKKICYSPDFGTEVFNKCDARALWKIISSGYGVCNGIAQIASYMLSQIGIKAIEVGSRTHGFLILKDIDMPTDKGIVKGDTILDPTWDLMAQRYGAYPDYFCKSYEEIRKKDILPSGEDIEAHKNDEELKDVKLNLDEKYVRQVYTSLGLAHEDGQFPIKSLKEESEKIYDLERTESETIKRQFMLFAKMYPDFVASINESTSII